MKLFDDLKKFALRGNVVDLVVGFTVGAAFTTIAKSLVDDIIMPPVGLLMGSLDFKDLFFVLKAPDGFEAGSLNAAKNTAGVVTINYGVFINLIINFIIVAFVMFLLIKGMNKMRKEAPAAPPPAPPRSETLLEEIRDLLKR